jgi:hypothetical protein
MSKYFNVNTDYGKVEIRQSEYNEARDNYLLFLKNMLIRDYPQLEVFDFDMINVLNNEKINTDIKAMKILQFCDKEQINTPRQHIKIDILPVKRHGVRRAF